ncbi:MAG: nucleotidyltransferase family protein [Candidatus Melainabacteria bacterium]|nr:nucleotidyltransferase family protein [Candidatus Melainabacteria bacterium]
MNQVDLIVEKREAIKSACHKYGATAVRIFGSCARDEYDEKSDIDVLIRLPGTLKGFKYFGTLGDLEDELKTILGVKVDLVDEAGLNGKRRERILKEAISL